MLVCHCNGISDRTIRRAIRAGATTVVEVQTACGAGECCGSCNPAIRSLLRIETAAERREAASGGEPEQTVAFA